jgi:hypothetical protein
MAFAIMTDHSDCLERELATVTAQRDRLAEALRNIVSIYENPAKGCIPCSSDMYDEAFQALTPNAESIHPESKP